MYYIFVKATCVVLLSIFVNVHDSHSSPNLSIDEQVQAIVKSSKSCTDAKSVGQGKCFGSYFQDQKIDSSRSSSQGMSEKREGDILVFVSLGMPEASLKAYDRDAKKIKGRLIIRGLVGDSFKKTKDELLKLGISVDIDPELFENYQVTVVPTIIQEGDDDQFDSLQGNIPLASALEIFAKKGDYKSQAVKNLKKIRSA